MPSDLPPDWLVPPKPVQPNGLGTGSPHWVAVEEVTAASGSYDDFDEVTQLTELTTIA